MKRTLTFFLSLFLLQSFCNLIAQNDDTVSAVYVGVEKYEHMNSLKYTVEDVLKMDSLMNARMNIDQSYILLDERATKNNMEYYIEEALKADVTYIFLSGHGWEESFLPADFDGLHNECLYKDIVSLINKGQARHVVLVIDGCHSGSIQRDLDEYLLCNKEKSVIALYGSQADGTSLESSGLRQGVFSHYLVLSLEYKNIQTYEYLAESVIWNIEEYTSKRQTPGIWYSQIHLKYYPAFGNMVPRPKRIVVLESEHDKPIVGYEFELW